LYEERKNSSELHSYAWLPRMLLNLSTKESFVSPDDRIRKSVFADPQRFDAQPESWDNSRFLVFPAKTKKIFSKAFSGVADPDPDSCGSVLKLFPWIRIQDSENGYQKEKKNIRF